MGAGGVKLFDCIVRTGVHGNTMRTNKFSSLLFSPGTLNGDVDNNYGLTSFANCHL